MLTHIVRHIFRTRGLRTSNLVYRWRRTTRISHMRHDLQGQRSRLQGHAISLSHLLPMLYLCHYRPAGAYHVNQSYQTRRPHFLSAQAYSKRKQMGNVSKSMLSDIYEVASDSPPRHIPTGQFRPSTFLLLPAVTAEI